MRIFALELNNDIKGISKRKTYIESLIAKLESPDIVLLPELSFCSYMASQEAWKYADDRGEVSMWAKEMAAKYHTYIGVGYLDLENEDYYNRYLIADKERVYGVVTKSEGEAAVFKRGWFDNIISTPFGNVAVGICYDSRRKHFYDNIRDKEISLIVFPHGCPADPRKSSREIEINDYLCGTYLDAFGVPVVYVNSVGKLEFMPGKMGRMMAKAGFRMNGRSKIYADSGEDIPGEIKEALGLATEVIPQKCKKEIKFYKNDLIKGNDLFRKLILEPDVKKGIEMYDKYHEGKIPKESLHMTEREKMLAGMLYDCGDSELLTRWHKAKDLVRDYNQTDSADQEKKDRILKELLGGRGANLWITAPFFVDYGNNIYFGNNCEVNMNCTFLDDNEIIIGNNALIAPNVQIYTAFHPTNAVEHFGEAKADGSFEFCKTQTAPVVIGDNVWIGGGAIIMPGVTIGDNVVIGAGSVVTKDIPGDVIAYGNPCRVIRENK